MTPLHSSSINSSKVFLDRCHGLQQPVRNWMLQVKIESAWKRGSVPENDNEDEEEDSNWRSNECV